MKKLVLLLVLLLVPSLASAATLHGTVYDLDFEVVENAVVEVDSQPKQNMIAIDGGYSFELNPGGYTLVAKYYIGSSLISSVEEEVNIVDDGDYVLDLILFPEFEDELVEDFDFDLEDNSLNMGYIILAIVIILSLIFFVFKKKLPKKKVLGLEKDEADEVLNFIRKEGGRTTQKDIRKNLGLSEAKASLIVTELEHKKIVKRIKKGRGNIIIFNK